MLQCGRTVLGIGIAALCCAPATLGQVQWRTTPADDQIGLGVQQAVATPMDVGERLAALAARPDARRAVVQLAGPVDAATRAELADSGVTLLRYLGEHAWFARLDAPRLDTAAVEGIVAAADPIETIHKLHPLLAQGEVPTWSQVGETEDADPVVGMYVVFHPDVDLGQAAGLVALYDGTVRDTVESIHMLVVELPLSAAVSLAAADEVQWVEPALPRMGENNNSNRVITQANAAQAAPYGLDGSGVTVMVYDGGVALSSHQDFGGRLTVRDGAGLSGHATHVAGTIGGSGAASGGTYRGMAPNVTLESYGFQYDGSGVFLYSNPGDMETDYDDAINDRGADISNNSIGTNTETNGFLCGLQGDYGATSATIDAIVRGSLGAPFRIVWAAGNERQGDRCDVEGFGDYYSNAPPGGAKNHICVGAVNSNNDSMTSFSSWGPVNDGRLKPDIVAPGCQSNEDGGVTSCTPLSTTSYGVLCGTSMASPTVCGLSALLLQDYRNQFPGADDPRNSTLKILLAHTAVDLGNTGPDYQFGYGSVRIVDAIDHMRTGRFLEDTITQSSTVQYTVSVSPGTSVLKLTMAWDDAPGTLNVNPALVNDLDLVVYAPNGARHYPWTLNPASPGAAAVRVQADHTNNIEQVLVNNPMAGEWRVEVLGYDVPEGPQPFSLTSSHALTGAGLRIRLFVVPSDFAPGVGASFLVRIEELSDTLVGGSPTLHVRYDGGAFITQPLVPLSGELYQATLPGPVCGATPEFYISAAGVGSGTVTSPPDAPTTVHAASVGTDVIVADHDFESNPGWTVSGSASDGHWERGVPQGLGGRGDPPVDFDGSGQCWLTDNAPGNSDVDNGSTTLTSNTYNLSGVSNPQLRVALWFTNDIYDNDSLTVQLSANGGASWTTVDVTTNTESWVLREYDIDSHVSLTSNFRVRFTAVDQGTQSVPEAAVDAFRIYSRVCTAVLDDCNENGMEDASEIASGLATDANGNGVPDDCDTGCPDSDGDGVCDADDVCPGFDDAIDSDGDGVPDGCDVCPGSDDAVDSDGDGVPDGCDVCPGSDDAVDSDGDGVPDGCDVCPGGDDTVDSDGDGTPDDCDCPEDINDDGVVDTGDLGMLLAQFGQVGPGLGADINGDNAVDVSDLGMLLGAFQQVCQP